MPFSYGIDNPPFATVLTAPSVRFCNIGCPDSSLCSKSPTPSLAYPPPPLAQDFYIHPKNAMSQKAKGVKPRSDLGTTSRSIDVNSLPSADLEPDQSPDSDASQSTDNGNLQPVDENFLQQLRVGAHLFHYPRQGDAATSFSKSPSAEYTMYSVIDVPTESDIVLTRSFDEQEEKKSYTWDDLLAGDWWYNPEAQHKK